jgi:hypothetical protein
MDVDDLLAGLRFDEELAKALAACDVFLAIIGPRWMELLRTRASSGDRDYVREEIAEALRRKIVVIPVRVGRDGQLPALPRADDLPPEIRDLVHYQKHDVTYEHFGRDASALVGAITAVRRHVRPKTAQVARPLPWGWSIGRIIVGFIAAALSVLIVHEGIIYLLGQVGLINLNRLAVWSMQPVSPWNVPEIVNRMFWGGLWGALFALVYPWIPGRASWLKGLIYGLGIVVVSNWILLPLIRGRFFQVGDPALFGGLDPLRMINTVLIVGGFGLALGIIYGLMARPRSLEGENA